MAVIGSGWRQSSLTEFDLDCIRQGPVGDGSCWVQFEPVHGPGWVEVAQPGNQAGCSLITGYSPLHARKEVPRDSSALPWRRRVPVIGGEGAGPASLVCRGDSKGRARKGLIFVCFVYRLRSKCIVFVINGGEQVIEEKKWRELMAAFEFPPTTHHQRLLRAAQVLPELAPPLRAASSRTRAPPSYRDERGEVASGAAPCGLRDIAKGPRMSRRTRIDGKFEYGYMVTVKIGTETLRGVLYHVQQQPSPAATPEAPESSSLRTRRKRRQQRRRDPAHPKPNKSAYNFFFAKKHSNLKALQLDTMPLCESDLLSSILFIHVHQDFGIKDKERYKREMQEHKERLKLAPFEEGK
ncbi:hypothetical protein ZIOFF_055082 [Zingiber officinale]|uniref:Uncharacterized protein n=1 Tax=Zingiber officinale TaxID=94328 RepID=A0A8J5FVL8_ZINOF|nr:hypothetical protein ZIOFF_055082 [Zingiber officinale]